MRTSTARPARWSKFVVEQARGDLGAARTSTPAHASHALALEMYGQVFCRVRARTLAVDLAGPGETVAQLKARALGGELDRARLTHLGRWLADETSTLAAAGVGPGSTLEATVSGAMRGGGGDGGATGAESRSCYLEMYADGGGKGFSRKAESLGGFIKYQTLSTVRDRDEREENLARWFNCTLTRSPWTRRRAASSSTASDPSSTRNPSSPRSETRRSTARPAPPPGAHHRHEGHHHAETAQKRREKIFREGRRRERRRRFVPTRRRGALLVPRLRIGLQRKDQILRVDASGLVVSDRALRGERHGDDMLGAEHALANQTRVPDQPEGQSWTRFERRWRRRRRKGGKEGEKGAKAPG